MKTRLPKENIQHVIFELSKKLKRFAKPYLTVHLGPRSNLLSKKKGRKSHELYTSTVKVL